MSRSLAARGRTKPATQQADSFSNANRATHPGQAVGFQSLQQLAGNRAVVRLMDAIASRGVARRPETAPPVDLAVQRTVASDLIDSYTEWQMLDEHGLGIHLLSRARLGDHNLVQQTLDTLRSTDRDDVSYEFCLAATPADLGNLILSPEGRALIDRLFDELTTGSVAAEEQEQADRLLLAKSSLVTPEDFGKAEQTAKVFPYRLSGLTVLHDAPLFAERRPSGRIWVNMPVRVLGASLFREETRTLPTETFISGIELPENEIVGVKMYDLGGEVVFRPALVLVQLANETDTHSLTKVAEIVGIGLTLGAGSLAGLGIEASMMARVLLWADRAAFALGTLTSIVREHRGEILQYGEPGKQFLRQVDFLHSATAIYGFGRVALSMGQVLSGLRASYRAWRTAADAVDGGLGPAVVEIGENTEALLKQADEIQSARRTRVAGGGQEPSPHGPPLLPTLSQSTEKHILELISDSNPAFPLTRNNAIQALEGPLGARVEVAGPGTKGADITFRQSVVEPGIRGNIVLRREIKCIKGDIRSFDDQVSHAAEQIDFSGDLFVQMPENTDGLKTILRWRGMRKSNPAALGRYRSIQIRIVDPGGSILYLGPLVH